MISEKGFETGSDKSTCSCRDSVIVMLPAAMSARPSSSDGIGSSRWSGSAQLSSAASPGSACCSCLDALRIQDDVGGQTAIAAAVVIEQTAAIGHGHGAPPAAPPCRPKSPVHSLSSVSRARVSVGAASGRADFSAPRPNMMISAMKTTGRHEGRILSPPGELLKRVNTPSVGAWPPAVARKLVGITPEACGFIQDGRPKFCWPLRPLCCAGGGHPPSAPGRPRGRAVCGGSEVTHGYGESRAGRPSSAGRARATARAAPALAQGRRRAGAERPGCGSPGEDRGGDPNRHRRHRHPCRHGCDHGSGARDAARRLSRPDILVTNSGGPPTAISATGPARTG